MKKFIFVLSTLFMLFALPLTVFCSGGDVLTEPSGLEVYFVSIAALAAIVLPVTNFIKNLIGSSGGWTVVLSWIVSIGLSFIGWWLKLGMFEGITIVWVLIYGVAVGMVANSLFDIGIVNAILSLFKQNKE
ncbi:MAG: hypothetical protein PVG07_00010 [Acidobacteriota bacterium]|jgi:hypothetical protein